MPSHLPQAMHVRRIASMALQGSGAPTSGRVVTRQVTARPMRLRHRPTERLVFLLDVSTEASAKQSAQPSFAAWYIVSSRPMRPWGDRTGGCVALPMRRYAAKHECKSTCNRCVS